uniref:BTB domain-containing protein n=1 Tax=Knipowitschia caucasica TaxID=637954 RepID=A0AAV2LSC7_KNICA
MRIYCTEVMESSCPVLQPGQCELLLRVNVDNHYFVVKKGLLAQHCEYFRALFQSGMKECQKDEICLQCVGLLGFGVMLKVLEGSQPMLNGDQIVEAIECTAFLQVPLLTKHLINIIDSENCLLMFHTASTYGVWELFHDSALFIRDIPNQLRYNLTLVGHEGCLFAIGGECEHKELTSVEKYQVGNGCWTGKGVTEVFEYLPQKDQWKLETTLVREQSYGLCMVGHRDNLYVMRNGPCNDFLLCVMDCYNLNSRQWTAMPGQYVNSKGSLFTAAVRGDSVFTLSRKVTTEYTIEDYKWRSKREMSGFGRIGSIYTFLMRLPQATLSLTERSTVSAPTHRSGDIVGHRRNLVRCVENI